MSRYLIVPEKAPQNGTRAWATCREMAESMRRALESISGSRWAIIAENR